MEQAAGFLLLLLAAVVLVNVANGTLRQWFRAKFNV